MLWKPKNKAFSILELLVVLFIIGLISIFSYPKIEDWLTDREVKAEVNRFVQYVEEKKSEVNNGKYGVYSIRVVSPEQAFGVNSYLTEEEYAIQMKVPALGRTNRNNPGQYGNKSIMNYYKMCPVTAKSSPDALWLQDQAGSYQWPSKVYVWPNQEYCISKNAILKQQPSDPFNLPPNVKASFIVCSTSNTTPASGNNRCNDANKNDFRYAIYLSRSLELSVYKYNLKKDIWVLQE